MRQPQGCCFSDEHVIDIRADGRVDAAEAVAGNHGSDGTIDG